MCVCFVDNPLLPISVKLLVLLQPQPQKIERPPCYNWLWKNEKTRQAWLSYQFCERWSTGSQNEPKGHAQKGTYFINMFSFLKNNQDKNEDKSLRYFQRR
jgi:hypothetical protein